MVKKILLTFFLVLIQTVVFGQSVGDYRSNVNTSGNWTSTSSWQRWDGSSWIVPSAGQGYPGQYIGTGAVSIQAGDVITANSDINNSIGILTISGQLTLRLESSNFINTQSVVVTPATGSILFGKKSDFNLPDNASLQVSKDGLTATNQGCDNNNSIFIGTIRYANCQGSGNTDTGLIFKNIMDGGGTLNAITASNSPVCQGSTINLFGSYTGAKGTDITYSWSITDPINITTTSTVQNPIISNSISGTYTITLTCSTIYDSRAYSNSEIILVTVNPSLSAPIVIITQPTCTLATGIITITAPTGVGTTYSIDGLTYTNTSGVFTSLASGTYSVTARNSSGCISNATSVVVKNATNTWSGSAWSNGTAPISTENIVFNGSYSTTADLVGCSCQVNNSVAVVVKSGHTLTLTNGLTVAPSASMTFENSASLVQMDNVPNSGKIKYVRTTKTAVLSTDYTYWSSPVSPQTIGAFSPKTKEGMMFSYDSNIDNWKQEYLSTEMDKGLGYIVRGPELSGVPGAPSPYMATFEGQPNNGYYPIPAIADRSYLLGNPYPSAIDADTFLAANEGVLNGTLYFWTHKTEIGVGVSNPGSGVYAYSGDDYATYNATGGVGTALPDIDPVTNQPITTAAAPSGGAKPNGFISAGQGFFASTQVAPSGNTIVFDNSMRVAGGTILTVGKVNEQFFKTRNPKKKVANPIEKNRVWLNLTNTQGAFKQTLVGYITDATNDYDSRFDGESFDGNEFVDFYSINADKNLTIQGRALPFDENDEVPLGFRTTINGTFTINIDQVDGLLANQKIFIEDKLTNTVTDLKSGNYTFSTTAGTFDDRFVLRYKDDTSNKTLGLDETESNDGIIVLYSNNYKTLIIRNNVQDAMVNSVTLFNMSGQKINSWEVIDKEQTGIQIPIKNLPSQIYIVKIKTTKGETSKKIIIK